MHNEFKRTTQNSYTTTAQINTQTQCLCAVCSSKSNRFYHSNFYTMDRRKINVEQTMHVLKKYINALFRSYVLPFLEEFFYKLDKAITFLVEALSEKDHSYQAEFIDASTVLSKYNKGFCIDGRKQISLSQSHMHALIVGASGSGKTQCTVLPTILQMESSFLINDPSGELYAKTAGYLKTKGYEVLTINFSNPSKSCGYNPLARIQTVSDAQKVAHLLVRNTLKGANDPFWNLQSVGLLTLLIRAVLFERKELQHLANVRYLLQLLSANHKVVDALIAKTGSQELITEYKSFLAFDTKVRLGVQATCLAALNIFSDPHVAQVTAIDTLDLEKMRKRKTVLYLHCNTSDMTFYAPLISLFFEQVSKLIMEKLPGKDDLPLAYILDEFSSLYMPNIQVTISNVRKYRVSMMLIVQDVTQIVDVYGKQQAEAIRSNCFSKLYFGGVSHQTASEISAQLGKYQYESDKGVTKTRELKTPDEIRTLSKDKAIFICGNYKPILLHLTPLYRHPYLKLRAEIPKPQLQGAIRETVVNYSS